MTTTPNDRYQRLQEIGKGGMGTVWEALDTKLGRRVALKDLDIKKDRLEDRQRWFEREASIQAKLKHDAVLEVYEYVDDDKEHPFYTMQLVSGGPKGEKPSIHDRLKIRQFALPEILDIARQLANALHYLWMNKVVHRDLKPANLLLENRGDGTVRLLIADFGLAVFHDQAEVTVTRAIPRGTPEYWAPEQKGGQQADYPMDVWGFGAVMHTLLKGRPPKHNEPPELSEQNDVPREFVMLVVDCLRIDPVKRPLIADVLARVDAVLRASHLGGSRVIGREKELAQLERFLDESREKAHFALIGGRPGIGKRHLVESLCRKAKNTGILVLRGVVTGDRLAPYVALCQVIEDYFQHAQEPADFSDLAPDLTLYFPLLKEIPQLASQTSTMRKQPTSDRGFALLASAFRRMAAQHHMLVVIENLHLGSVSVEAIRRIVAQATKSKFLLLATYDNSEPDALSALREDIRRGPSVYADISLRPFTEDEDRRLLAELLGSDQIAAETISVTREHCGGIPLITTLLVADARNRRDLVQRADGLWQFREDAQISAQSLPDVQELIDRSRDRLNETLRKLIDHASVAIDTFTLAELGCLTSRRGKRLEEDVNILIKSDLLKEERPGRFAFARRAVRERVHDRLDGTLRKTAHRKLGIYREQKNREKKAKISTVICGGTFKRLAFGTRCVSTVSNTPSIH